MDAPRTKSFSRLIANLSWVCPIITIIILALLIFSRQIVPRRIIALVASGALCLIAVGLIFGIVALFGISKQGTKGILAPAIVGIIINGLLLAFVVTNFMTARFRAIQQRGDIETPPVVRSSVPVGGCRSPLATSHAMTVEITYLYVWTVQWSGGT